MKLTTADISGRHLGSPSDSVAPFHRRYRNPIECR
jgi:hypothetical protein